MTGGPAGATLASVPELVEIILLQLPLRDVLFAQRVDRTWHAIIANSPQLQRALFFKPAVNTTVAFHGPDPAIGSCTSQLRCTGGQDPVEPCASPDTTTIEEWRTAEGVPYEGIWLSPFIRCFASPLIWHRLQDLGVAKRRAGAPELRRTLSAAARRPEATWRKMLLTQPPVSEIVVDNGVARHWHALKARDELQGVTVEEYHSQAECFDGNICQIMGDELMRRFSRCSGTD